MADDWHALTGSESSWSARLDAAGSLALDVIPAVRTLSTLGRFGMFAEGAGSAGGYGSRLASQAGGQAGVLGVAENNQLISGIKRISSNTANKPFMTEKAKAEGWQPPYLANLSLREISTTQEIPFVRAFSGDNPIGRFLVRQEEIAHIINNPEALKIYLGLKDVPTSISPVLVPANIRMLVGRIGPQPRFGLMDKSGFQYQLLEDIPKSNFGTPQLILDKNNLFNYRP